MARIRELRIVVATDGSPGGRAAVAVALEFPWPARSQAQGVVARFRPLPAEDWPAPLWAAIHDSLDRVANAARRALRGRWPTAEVVVLDKPPAEAVVAEARGAGAIVIGSCGHGALGRLVLGSVSRDVVRRAGCPTLVVRSRPRSGWGVRSAIRWGIPLDELLTAVGDADAHVLVVGARGTGGVARMFLGSVAEGVLSRARVPVLVVR